MARPPRNCYGDPEPDRARYQHNVASSRLYNRHAVALCRL